MLVSRRHRRTFAFTLVEVLVVSALITSLHSQGQYGYAINAANQVKGISNLQQIYTLLQLQSLQTGRLPQAAFYPQGDPLKDPKSIVRLVQDAPAALFVSPFAPEALKKTGLTFAWNDTVSGKDLSAVPADTWLMLDLVAFITDPNVPKPTNYLILYADGKAVAADKLPDDVLKAVKEAQEKQAKDAEAAAAGGAAQRPAAAE